MGTFFFILAFVFVLSFYAYSIRLRKDKVLVAFTQPTDDPAFVGAQKRSYYKKHKVYKDPEGKIINPETMMIIFVSGNGMSPKINQGDEIIINKIDKNRDLEEQIKSEDILLFFLEDKGMYYLRRFCDFCDSQEELNTYYTDTYGNACFSIDKTKTVCGIAKYKIGESLMC